MQLVHVYLPGFHLCEHKQLCCHAMVSLSIICFISTTKETMAVFPKLQWMVIHLILAVLITYASQVMWVLCIGKSKCYIYTHQAGRFLFTSFAFLLKSYSCGRSYNASLLVHGHPIHELKPNYGMCSTVVPLSFNIGSHVVEMQRNLA